MDAAHRHGIPVRVCGEMASDPVFAALLLGLGVDELQRGGPAGRTSQIPDPPAQTSGSQGSWPISLWNAKSGRRDSRPLPGIRSPGRPEPIRNEISRNDSARYFCWNRERCPWLYQPLPGEKVCDAADHPGTGQISRQKLVELTVTQLRARHRITTRNKDFQGRFFSANGSTRSAESLVAKWQLPSMNCRTGR